MENKEQMNIVIVGHVDHGKSTVVGRLLADTNSLPKGKLQQVKDYCKNNSKTFEYAFLLDALKDEQAQGITIDSARCFFKSKKREYIIIDAPGHIEFLKNMISGAARAEAAVLVIDADEGIQENSKRHAYMLSLLGINQVLVCVNKMDLIEYKEDVYNGIEKEFATFLNTINIKPKGFIPVSAREGDNIAINTKNLDWFKGPTILQALDEFKKEALSENKPFRMPVQDIYKFTGLGDSRRILAGRVTSGKANVGDKVIFLPSYKTSTIASIEEFNTKEKNAISVGESTGVILTEQIFAMRGEIMCKENEPLPIVSTKIVVNIFWMGKEPLTIGKEYKLKIATTETLATIKEIKNALNSSSLEKTTQKIIKRHEVGECVIETKNPVAFDTFSTMKETGRFVLVDNYEIRGGGIITGALTDEQDQAREQKYLREKSWDSSNITFKERATRYGQMPVMVLITGPTGKDKKGVAKNMEKVLFTQGRSPYFLGIGNLLRGLDADIDKEERQEHIRRLGEVAHILLDAGLIVLATASDLTKEEIQLIKTIVNKKSLITIGIDEDQNNGIIDLHLEEKAGIESNTSKIINKLKEEEYVFYQ